MNEVQDGSKEERSTPWSKLWLSIFLFQNNSGYQTSESYNVEIEDMRRQIYGDKNLIIKYIH